MKFLFFFFQAEDGIRDVAVTGVQTCALPIFVVVLILRLNIRRFCLYLCRNLLLHCTRHGFGVEVGLIPGAKQFFAGVASGVLSKTLFFISEGLFGCAARLVIELLALSCRSRLGA